PASPSPAPRKPDEGPGPGGWFTRRRRVALGVAACCAAVPALLLLVGAVGSGEAPKGKRSLLQSGQQALVQVRDTARSLLGGGSAAPPEAAAAASPRATPASRPARRPAPRPERPPEKVSVVAEVIPVSWILAGGVAPPAPPDAALEDIVGSEALFDASSGGV